MITTKHGNLRLIDANALKDDILKSAVMIDDRGIQTGYEIAIELIKKQPTIDAEPVIRCYECKYFTEFEKGFSSDWDGSCRYWNTHSTVYSNFCGCGARMDKE